MKLHDKKKNQHNYCLLKTYTRWMLEESIQQQCKFMFCLPLCSPHMTSLKKLQPCEGRCALTQDSNHVVSQVTNIATMFAISPIQTLVTIKRQGCRTNFILESKLTLAVIKIVRRRSHFSLFLCRSFLIKTGFCKFYLCSGFFFPNRPGGNSKLHASAFKNLWEHIKWSTIRTVNWELIVFSL